LQETEKKKWQEASNSHIVRVTYRDTDQMGYVYYANYLVWFEIGRTELLRNTGYSYSEFEEMGFVLPVLHCECNYKKPAHYDDLIRIETSVINISRASLCFKYRIFRDNTGELLAHGITKHAVVNKDGRVVRAGKILEEWFDSHA
jgi:acyl-CoA thioester hydrolase